MLVYRGYALHADLFIQLFITHARCVIQVQQQDEGLDEEIEGD